MQEALYFQKCCPDPLTYLLSLHHENFQLIHLHPLKALNFNPLSAKFIKWLNTLKGIDA